MAKVTCQKCGVVATSATAKFCKGCGTRVTASSASSPNNKSNKGKHKLPSSRARASSNKKKTTNTAAAAATNSNSNSTRTRAKTPSKYHTASSSKIAAYIQQYSSSSNSTGSSSGNGGYAQSTYTTAGPRGPGAVGAMPTTPPPPTRNSAAPGNSPFARAKATAGGQQLLLMDDNASTSTGYLGANTLKTNSSRNASAANNNAAHHATLKNNSDTDHTARAWMTSLPPDRRLNDSGTRAFQRILSDALQNQFFNDIHEFRRCFAVFADTRRAATSMAPHALGGGGGCTAASLPKATATQGAHAHIVSFGSYLDLSNATREQLLLRDTGSAKHANDLEDHSGKTKVKRMHKKVKKMFKRSKKKGEEEAADDLSYVHIHLVEGHNVFKLSHRDEKTKKSANAADPACRMYVLSSYAVPVDGKHSVHSSILENTTNPLWNEFHVIPFAVDEDALVLDLHDGDPNKSDSKKKFLGRVLIPFAHMRAAANAGTRGVRYGWYRVFDDKRLQHASAASLHLGFCFAPKDAARDRAQTSVLFAPKPAAALPYTSQLHNLRCCFTTWNMGNTPPPPSLSDIIPVGGYDIYVVGTQECNYVPREGFSSCAADWESTMVRHFGQDYTMVKYHCMSEMRVAIVCRNELHTNVTGVTVHTEATGVGGIMGNKGGVVVGFYIYHTACVVANCHLAPHQEGVQKRNEQMRDVIKHSVVGRKARGRMMYPDLLNQFHHTFVMGDLNYRLDFGNQGKDKKPSPEQFAAMSEMIERGQFGPLFLTDQLCKEQLAGNVLVGFSEGSYNFPPTFKVLRHTTPTVWDPKRSPAWCDRVLWRSVGGVHIKESETTSCQSVLTSDHKPVSVGLWVESFVLPTAVDVGRPACRITLSNIRATGLISVHARRAAKQKAKGAGISKAFGAIKTAVKDIAQGNDSSAANVFVVMSSDFLEGALKTDLTDLKTCAWDEHLDAACRFNRPSRLARHHLAVEVMVRSVGLDSLRMMGQALIPLSVIPGLNDGCHSDACLETQVVQHLNYGGLPAGSISCTLKLEWGRPDAPQRESGSIKI